MVTSQLIDTVNVPPVHRPESQSEVERTSGETSHPMLHLQRQLGNAHIARMLAQREEAIKTEEEDEEAKKLLQATHDPAVAQRADAPVPEEEDEEQLLQASPEVGLEGGPVSDTLADQIEAQRGGGSPLDGGTRDSMEQSFGTSFEDVRVHSGAESQQLNRSISAKAFTTGSDIFLGKDASANDGSLMAHELTHVVQQQSMDTSGPMTVGPAGDGYEQQADAAAAAVTAGGSAPAAQRKEDV
ncbi:MAG: DUF4157 domain-containing protein [Roseiflexaceae bacterium]|nr:DUF4157 domain-containing protein [Roseiflexaceae bacterium]